MPRFDTTPEGRARAAAAGRIGGDRRIALHGTAAAAAHAKSALRARLIAEIDPNGVLPPDELEVRLRHGRRAYFRALATRRWNAHRREQARSAQDGQGVPATPTSA